MHSLIFNFGGGDDSAAGAEGGYPPLCPGTITACLPSCPKDLIIFKFAAPSVSESGSFDRFINLGFRRFRNLAKLYFVLPVQFTTCTRSSITFIVDYSNLLLRLISLKQLSIISPPFTMSYNAASTDAEKNKNSNAGANSASFQSDDSTNSNFTKDFDDTPQNAPASHRGAPDGGAAAWLLVLGAWCTSFCSFGWINSAYFITSIPNYHV
jgi:hypothetical protein